MFVSGTNSTAATHKTTPRTEGWKELLLLPPQGELASLIDHSTWKNLVRGGTMPDTVRRQPSKKMLSYAPFIAMVTD